MVGLKRKGAEEQGGWKMNGTLEAKTAILERIRGATNKAGLQIREREYAAIPRRYIHQGQQSTAKRLDLFEDRLREYDAGVCRTAAAELQKTIARILTDRKAHRLAIPRGIPSSWLPQGFAFHLAEDIPAVDLDRLDGVLTGCTVAIAETGSLVLQNAERQGPRQLSLVPDYHCCIVFADQVVETVPESFAWLTATATLPTTFISGPSATADIEMTRIKGVHGPRFLDVVLVLP
jgi:L-lactate dehydrogenase complex protein LldG